MTGNVFSSLATLQKNRMPSPGGLCSVDFVPVDWILWMPEIDPRYGTISQAVRLQTGRKWLRLTVPDRDRALLEAQKSSDAGAYVESTITGYLPSGTAKNEVMLRVMRYFRYILVINLPTGIRKLIGTIENPALFSRDFNSGENMQADAGSPLQFSWISEDGPALYLVIPSETDIVAAAPRYILASVSDPLGDGTGLPFETNIFP